MPRCVYIIKTIHHHRQTETGFFFKHFRFNSNINTETQFLCHGEIKGLFGLGMGGDRILWQFRSGDSETGFLFSYLGEDANTVAETRFLCIR